MTENPAGSGALIGTPRRRNHAIWLGPIITVVAGFSYFSYFAQFPALRDFPWVNLIMVAFGILLSVHGVWRAFSPSLPYRGKILSPVGLIVSLFLGGFFNVYIFSISYSLPEPTGVSLEMNTAPDFTLMDQHGQPVSLADLRGSKVVLTFYRGFW